MPHDQSTQRRPTLGVWALLTLTLAIAGCNREEAAHAERLAKAKAIFAERCKTAGVVIKRTVQDVEGIELTKIRPKLEYADRRYFDPMFDGAAMAGEVNGTDYIKQFLMYEFRSPDQPRVRGGLGPITNEKRHTRRDPMKGYDFVEYDDTADKSRYRCTPDWSLDHPNWVDGQHRCEAVSESQTRYALDYEDLVDRADRAYWVAGTKLRVIDKQTGEVTAELTRFVIDTGFGGGSTGRWPWSHASMRADQQCPVDPLQRTGNQSRYFVDTVLIPKQAD